MEKKNVELVSSNLNFFKSDAAWQGIAGRSGFSAKTSISFPPGTEHRMQATATLCTSLPKDDFPLVTMKEDIYQKTNNCIAYFEFGD